MTSFSVVFMGTPAFAVPSLQALQKAGYEIKAVYSQPPRPAGRGYSLKPSPVHLYAQSQGWEVRTPSTLRSEEAQESLAALAPHVIVVAAYGLLLPPAVLKIPPLGCINVHGSLLPRWRGAAPLQRALLAGDKETGITIMQMEAGLDTGPMLLTETLPLPPTMTFSRLHDELATQGGHLLIQALEGLRQGTLESLPQPPEGVTYASKIQKQEGLLSWSLSAEELDRKVRALTPAPGTWFLLGPQRIKVLESQLFPSLSQGQVGEVLDTSLTIQCTQGALRLLKLQKAGGVPVDAAAFLRGCPLPPGTILPCPGIDSL